MTEIPLHPAVIAEMARGREFLDQLSTARRNIERLTVTTACPDGDNQIAARARADDTAPGMVIDAAFTEDLFDRYPGDTLRELLLAMCEEGFGEVSAKVSAEVAAILDEQR